MWIDSSSPAVRGSSRGKFVGLDLLTPFYLGGVPDAVNAAEDTDLTHGFVGCVGRLLVNGRPQVLAPNEVRKRLSSESGSFSSTSVGAVVGVTGCEPCAEAPCKNGGVCQEDNTDRGYR